MSTTRRHFLATAAGAVFGFRAAGPARLSNLGYFDRKVCLWDAETMKLKG